MHKIKYFLFLFFISAVINAQELNTRVTVVSTRVGSNVNKNTFITLQTALNNFLNNRKWSSETYAPNERIECNFLLNLESTSDLNVYKGTLTIQAAIDGQGVALGDSNLVADDLAAGRLVKPFELSLKAPDSFSYFVITRLNTSDAPLVNAFRDWCLAEAETGRDSDAKSG